MTFMFLGTNGLFHRDLATPYGRHTVYPTKYAHGFVVLCFVVVMQSFIMNSDEVFIHIHQGCFAGTGAIVRLPQCQWKQKPCAYFLGYTVNLRQHWLGYSLLPNDTTHYLSQCWLTIKGVCGIHMLAISQKVHELYLLGDNTFKITITSARDMWINSRICVSATYQQCVR